MLRFFFNKYPTSLEKLVNLRRNLSLKICYRPTLSFLKYRINLTNSLSNRLVLRSQFQRSYIDLREYYIRTIRANFGLLILEKNYNYFFKNIQNTKFHNFYHKTTLMNDFDFALAWKANEYNCMFEIQSFKKKKKKKITYQQKIKFIKPEKRLLFVWKTLCLINRSLYVKKVPKKLSLIKTFENFFLTNPQSNLVNTYKLQIYKLHLLRAVQ